MKIYKIFKKYKRNEKHAKWPPRTSVRFIFAEINLKIRQIHLFNLLAKTNPQKILSQKVSIGMLLFSKQINLLFKQCKLRTVTYMLKSCFYWV